MTAAQDIQFGVAGQSLILDCEDGRPASVTSVSVYAIDADDTTTPEDATTGSASIESTPNTTLSAAAGAGANPATLSLTSASGVATGRAYLLTAASGLSELVHVVALSGTTAYLRTPLLNDYASGSTFVSTRASVDLSSAWVADQHHLSATFAPAPRWRARWVVVDAAGTTQVYERHFDLVRYPARHGVTPGEMEARFPGWLDSLPVDYRAEQGRALLSRALTAVKFDLYADGIADQAVRNPEALSELVMTRANLLSIEDAINRGAAVDPARYEVADKVFRQRYEQIVRAPVLTIDKTGGGAASTVTPSTLWRR